MKRLFSVLLLALSLHTAHAQTKASDVARFAPETVQLGTLTQGVPATATFTVTNTGKSPLIIEKAIPGCGCTLAEYTKTPILPGKTGTITATYNAAAAGPFSKTVSVKFFKVDDVATLSISGEVKVAGTAAN